MYETLVDVRKRTDFIIRSLDNSYDVDARMAFIMLYDMREYIDLVLEHEEKMKIKLSK